MNKKLKSLILSGVLVGSMVSAPTFATENEEQEPTLITEVAEVFKEEPLSKEEVHSDNQLSDDEIPEIDDSETTPTESKTPLDETIAPDTIEPVEEAEESQTEGEADDKGPSLYSNKVPTDMPLLKVDDEEIKNAYEGEYWLNDNFHGSYIKGIPQGQYVDHIDVRIDNATVKINYIENGESKVKNAIVTHVSDILINDQKFKYIYAGNKREDGVVREDEFNFQIVDHKDGKKENYNYKDYWLDLNSVKKITIMATLTVHEDDGTYTHYDVPIVIEGLKKIVETSVCSNASGLDYYLKGDISDIVEEIPPSFTPDEIDINLTPGTGDISVYGDLYYPVFALAILVAINKKNNKN